MRIITLTFYLAIGAVLAWFAARNWLPVTLILWDGAELVTRLPVLLFAAFLLGALPLALLHSFSKWRWRRRIEKLEAGRVDTADVRRGRVPRLSDEPENRTLSSL